MGHQTGQRGLVVVQQVDAAQAQRGVVEHGVGRAGRGAGRVELGGRDRLDPAGVVARGRQDRPGELEPATPRPGW